MSEYEIDSQLKEMLDLLRPVPERSSDAMYRSRTQFNADLEGFFPDGATHRGSLRAQNSKPAVNSKPVVVAARPKPWFYQPAFAYLALTLVIVVAMFSGGFITVLAASSALPGDALYALKLNAEQVRVSLTADPSRQSELYLEFAQNRLVEMNALAALGEYDKVAPLATQFNDNIAMAVGTARRLADREPERAVLLENQALTTLGLLKPTVDLVISNAPLSLQPALQAAFDQASQWNPPVDNVDPNAKENNGGGGGNGNPNGNGNAGSANGEGNPANRNANANSNSNSKANSNSNGSPGTAINGNSNDNSNANPNNNGKNDNKNNNGKNDDKNNNGKNDDKNNNGKNDDKNNNGKNGQP